MRGGKTKAQIEALIKSGYEFAECRLVFEKPNTIYGLPPSLTFPTFQTLQEAINFYETYKALKDKK